MNVAYKHLEAKLRVAELTLSQWLGVCLGVCLAIAWGYISPLGSYLTLLSAIYLGAVPAGAAFLASVSELDLWLLVRSALRWRRLEGRFLPGPGAPSPGYVLIEPDEERAYEQRRRQVPDLDLGSLWKS